MSEPNASMAAMWNGPTGAQWVANADHHDRALAVWGEAVLVAGAPGGADRVLDVGCGTGSVTRAAARRAAGGHATGVDVNELAIAHARARAGDEGPANVDFAVGDAQVHPFAPGALDLAISRFGLMFFDDPEAAFANIGRALAPGGRLAFACWQPLAANDWAAVPAAAMAEHVGYPPMMAPGAPGPYSLSEPGRIRAVLDAGGFDQVAIDGLDGAMWLGSDADDAYRFMTERPTVRAVLEGKDPAAAGRALDALRATLAAAAGPGGVAMPARAWIVTARRP